MSFDYLLKCIVVGNSGVGKSSILLQFIDHKFADEHKLTIGVEFGARTIQVGDKKVKIQIWDTAGQEHFRSITRAYYRDAAIVVLVFDVTDADSFNALQIWIDDINDMTNNPQIILVGNKIDNVFKNSTRLMRQDIGTSRSTGNFTTNICDRTITYQDALDFAENNNMQYIEASAKHGINIDEIFYNPTSRIITKIDLGEINCNDPSRGIKCVTKHCNVIDKKIDCKLTDTNTKHRDRKSKPNCCQ